MCGIAGVLAANLDKADLVKKMVRRLIHRGPDDEGYWENHSYAAGMRRLSINDIEGGAQPLFGCADRTVLFYNGEIYNSPALRKQLIYEGYTFRTKGDGEVICHLYHKYGLKFLGKLDGMFAIALWDRESETLLLARDFPGEKPLYFSRLPKGGVAFASEIPALMAANLVRDELNLQAIWDFPTFLWIPEPATIFQRVESLMPGHYLVARAGGSVQIESFVKDLPGAATLFSEDIREKICQVKGVVSEAVESRLLSDVPIGAFLSGGLDSSIICTLAKRRLSELNTFCIGFENAKDPYHGYSDESTFAEEYAAFLGCNHTTIRIGSNEFRDLLPQLNKSAGQPYAVSSGLGILAIAREAQARGIKVLLSGDGADEAFGGYSWYKDLSTGHPTSSRVGPLLRYIESGDDRWHRAARTAGYSSQERAWSYHYYASELEKSFLFGEAMGGQNASLRWFEPSSLMDPIDYIRHDRSFYFPNEMLTKVDRMTMAYSVEGRAPFAAYAVQFLAERLSLNDLIRDDTLKWVLREAFRDQIPTAILDREKHGFNVPIDHWLQDEWRDIFEETFAADSCLVHAGIIGRGARQWAINEMKNPKKVLGHVIFPFIMLNLWMSEYESGNYC